MVNTQANRSGPIGVVGLWHLGSVTAGCLQLVRTLAGTVELLGHEVDQLGCFLDGDIDKVDLVANVGVSGRLG